MTRALAAIFAHPDDETFATGATLAKYSGQGVRCSLYCATDGDAGKTAGLPVSSRAELDRIRRAELKAACGVLGVAPIDFGGHPDGAIAATEPDLVIGEIVAHLRRERPQVVLTFGPEGAPTQHRDHRAISRLATAAFLLAGTATAFPEQLEGGLAPHWPARLCYVTWPRPAANSPYPAEGQPTELRIDARPWLARKSEAFAAHATQQFSRKHFDALALLDTEDYFVAIGAPVGTPIGAAAAAPADDLFAGLP